ncbi:MAG TPA: hypothetical protein VKR06_17150 [Ktedonosporobacter sp.]|nr:hypothetical protein [Ktedonosporobacter sp.]
MNCSHARTMLAAYRELPIGQTETAEDAMNRSLADTMNRSLLEKHLEGCADCRQTLAQYDLIGTRVRSLPVIEPSPTAHIKLMQALAMEHAHFIQNAPSSAQTRPTPTFLAPYLKQAQNVRRSDAITTFSTADTGPLPLLQAPRRIRRSYPMPQFAIIGLAAVFLMALMTGGLTSLLLLARPGVPPASIANNSIQNALQVASQSYTTATPYTHVASAVADQQSIYYTAYGDTPTGWMLEQFDGKTKTSTPLLPTESTNPLIVLGSSNNWLVWLELGAAKPVAKHGLNPNNETTRTWNLHASFIGGNQTKLPGGTQSISLQKDTFDQATVPSWVSTPVQGVWFAQNTLFVASIDAKGTSSLWSYQLDPVKSLISNQIATAQTPGHILNSPTATSDGKNIYWSEEWLADNNVAHSNIWTRQNMTVPISPGRWVPHTVTNRHLFLSDQMSFRPQVVNDTLFLLSTSTTDATNTTQATPQTTAAATPVATPTTTNELDTTGITRTDPAIYPAPLDQTIRGTLVAFAADGSSLPVQLPPNSVKQISDLQGGPRFLIWQDGTNTFKMYDTIAKLPVKVDPLVPKNATFLAVNGDTAVWTVNKDSTASSTNSSDTTNPTVSFSMFSWPPTATVTQNSQ